MYALTGTTGKIGGAVLQAILKYKIIPINELVICTSSSPSSSQWDTLKSGGAQIRSSNYDDPESMVQAFSGCEKLFLVSTPRIEMDFNDAPYGEGREKHHFAAIDAARKAGVKHLFYTSLAFGDESPAGVMRAHLRTEAYLKKLSTDAFKVTIIREGLYNESWPLYFGHYNVKNEQRTEFVIAGDGPISWTSVPDLGVANALVLADPSEKYVGKTFYLSNQEEATTLEELAKLVVAAGGKETRVKVVSADEYCKYYNSKEGQSMGPMIPWWVGSYQALEAQECWIKERQVSFSELLSSKGVTPLSIKDTVKEMLAGKQ
ncbi:nmrA-like family protein [Phlyctema vagabunda]|uniref:NmrA-like family protein n=1 Tax=Phlyctema vagabunda TaxID=108571 RepID=A0ABR4PBN6_9HELO